MQIKQNTATINLVFFMADSADHVTGKTGLSMTVGISKNGGSFTSPAGAVTEIGAGFYRVAANATDSNTLGVLALSATAVGADQAAMAYEVVANIESDSISAIGALNNLSAAGVRTELATELARIDAAISSRNATTPPTTAAIRAELATELARIDASVSSRNATTPPTVAAIADAVCDEVLSGHATVGTVGAALTASGASGDPWANVVPGSYADGTAGAAIGRLNNTPAANPIAIAPMPLEDPDLCNVFVDTEKITGVADPTLIIVAKLKTPLPARTQSGRLATNETVEMEYDEDVPGRYTAALESGLIYEIECRKLWKTNLIVTINAGTETLDIGEP